MNTNRLLVPGIMIALGTLIVNVWDIPAYALNQSISEPMNFNMDQFTRETHQTMGVQLIARSKTRQGQASTGGLNAAGTKSMKNSVNSQKVPPKWTFTAIGNPRCWNECAARGIMDSASCAQKCGGPRPPQRR